MSRFWCRDSICYGYDYLGALIMLKSVSNFFIFFNSLIGNKNKNKIDIDHHYMSLADKNKNKIDIHHHYMNLAGWNLIK